MMMYRRRYPMRKINMLTFAAGVIALTSCLPAMAQVKATFTTTFGFYAGGAKLPAGTYTIRQMQDDPNTFELQDGAVTVRGLRVGRASCKRLKLSPSI